MPFGRWWRTVLEMTRGALVEPILEASGLRKRFGKLTAVDGVTLEVAAGETYGLLGPNGAGKTTTVSMICGLLDPDDGSVAVAGEPMRGSSARAKANIGYVPQELALYLDLTARENLRFFGRLYALSGADLTSRVDRVLSLVGLGDRADERVDHFSGGMKRRLNIGAGLLHDPKLLILDEPTVGVDPQSRNAILESVADLAKGGVAVLYTTHYMEEAERLCDRVGIIDEGKIIAEGTRRELVEKIGELDRVEIAAKGNIERFVAALQPMEGVRDVASTDTGLHLVVHEGRHMLPKVLDVAEDCDVDVTSVEVIEPDLEAVFLHLTGKALRD
jgi:ABC-2 type transport system ATP-binding protein